MITRCRKERSWIIEKATLGINVSPPMFIFVLTIGKYLGKIQEILVNLINKVYLKRSLLKHCYNFKIELYLQSLNVQRLEGEYC